MLWCIKNNILINWPHQIMQHILKCRDNNVAFSYTSVHLSWSNYFVKKNFAQIQYFWSEGGNMIWWTRMMKKMVKSYHNQMTMFNNPHPKD